MITVVLGLSQDILYMMYCIYGTRQLQNMNVPGIYVIITLDYDIQMGAIDYGIYTMAHSIYYFFRIQ